MAAPLKVAFIVDEENLDEHRLALAEWACSTATVRVTHLIIQERDAAPKAALPVRLLRKSPAMLAAQTLWKVKHRLEERHESRAPGDDARLQRIGRAVPGRIRVRPRISPSGFVYRYGEEDLARIEAEGFDVLIRCGSGILRGGILSSARLGVLSFHHGDNRVNRGGPAGFWEVYHRWSTTGWVLQRLTEELDGGDVLLRGSIPTQDTHARNCALLYDKSYFQLRALLLRIAETGSLPTPEPHLPYTSRLYTNPRAGEIARYLARRVRRSMVWHVRERLQMRERWGVCFMKSDWPDASFWRGKRIETPPGRFLADPFVATREGRACVFVEDYSYSASKGRISAFELGENGARELGVALEENFHLSFPYLFEHEGALFMCPEAAASGEIRIYRCVEFPLTWRLERIAMSGVSAVDSMILPHGGRWWLLTNLSEVPPVEHSAQLHVFSAADPLAGPWEAHPRNPVRNDPAHGRNAGLVRRGGDLVRVCQAQGFGSYGAGATLMRIVRLDRESFAEEPVCQLTPGFLPGAHGTHHLHSNGEYSVWDYKRWERVRCKAENRQPRQSPPAALPAAVPCPTVPVLSVRAELPTGVGRADG